MMYDDSEGYLRGLKRLKTLEGQQEMLFGLDMSPRDTFILSKVDSVDTRVLSKVGPAMALAPKGPTVLRIRSKYGREAAQAAYVEMPWYHTTAAFSQPGVEKRVTGYFYASGGAEMTLGRIKAAYPRTGAVVAKPVTREEAREALIRSGLGKISTLPVHALRPYPILDSGGEVCLSVNKHASNGFPVGGNLMDPDAVSKVLGLVASIEGELRGKSTDQVTAWYRRMQTEAPHLVACMGKAKSDHYSMAKIEGHKLRFYNVVGRQIALLIQQGTQVLEGYSNHMLEDKRVRTAQGVSLVRGGAEALVQQLDEQLAETGFAYSHVGDDSWVIVRSGEDVIMFSLDCTNFDLTQHSDTMAEIHLAVRDVLSKVSPTSAGLWYGLMRERLVVTSSSLVRLWKHAGPSGSPMQSKVNDMLMDVLLQRMEARRDEVLWGYDEEMSSFVFREGKKLGLEVRVENLRTVRAATLRDALHQFPFLYIGYYFYGEMGKISVIADLPRSLSQMQYPHSGWEKSKDVLQVKEAMRVGAILINWGVPPKVLEPAYNAVRAYGMVLLEDCITAGLTVKSDILLWAMDHGPGGATLEPTLRGMRDALSRDPRELWNTRDVPLQSQSRWVSVTWADEMDEEDQSEVVRLTGKDLLEVPAAGRLPKRALIGARPPPTHPTTGANDGRPAPTSRWAPDKPPVAHVERMSARTRRRDGLLARAFIEEQNELYDYSDSD